MTKQRKDTDYLFLSARIRAMERRLLTAQRLEQLLTAAPVWKLVNLGDPDSARLTHDTLCGEETI